MANFAACQYIILVFDSLIQFEIVIVKIWNKINSQFYLKKCEITIPFVSTSLSKWL